MGGFRLKKIAIGFVVLLVLLALVLLALPLWLPWVLPALLGRFGLEYAQYERRGYNRLVLRDAVYQTDQLRFEAREIETLAPLPLLWRHFRRHPPREDVLRVADWSLDFLEPPEEPPPPAPVPAPETPELSIYALLEQTEDALTQVQEWIPRAFLTNGVVRFQDQQFLAPELRLRNHRLSGRLVAVAHEQEAEVEAHLPPGQPWHINVTVQPLGIKTQLSILRRQGSVQVEGTGLWEANEIEFGGTFPSDALWPSRAWLRTGPLQIPPEIHSVEGYQALLGSARLDWESGQFQLHAEARAEPVPGWETPRVPLEAALSAAGGTNRFQVDQLSVKAPFIELGLFEPAELDFTGQLLSPAAVLRFEGDLGEQPWFDLEGGFAGEIRIQPGPDRMPVARLQLEGEHLRAFDVAVERLGLGAGLVWPEATLEEAALSFADGSFLAGTGVADLQERQVRTLAFQAAGPFANAFLPPGYSYENLELTGEVNGSLEEFSHSGAGRIDQVRMPDFHPVDLRLDWQGENLSLNPLRLELSAGSSRVQLQGRGARSAIGAEAELTQFRFTRAERLIWELERPSSFSLHEAERDEDDGESRFKVQVEPLELRGAADLALAAELEWPRRGRLRATARNLRPQMFEEFYERELPRVLIEALSLQGHWDETPLEFSLSLSSHYEPDSGFPLELEAHLSGDSSGLVLERFELASLGEDVLVGEGALPITLEPAHPERLVQMHSEYPLLLRGVTHPGSPFWSAISTETGIRLEDPRLAIGISGTLGSPEGTVTLDVEKLDLKQMFPEQEIPGLSGLSIRLSLREERLAIDRFAVVVEGQPVEASATVPLDLRNLNAWQDLLQLDRLEARLLLAETPLAPFIRFIPVQLAPQGTVAADLAVRPGWEFEGEIVVREAATRPLLPLGPIHEIGARIGFEQQAVLIEEVRGLLGGEAVLIQGRVDLGQIHPLTGLPALRLTIQGTNVPLARQPDLILRSDLDLLISNQEDSPPVIEGKVNLRDSFFLSDLRMLVPGQIATPARRPPYFRVTAPPVASWGLDLEVSGTEFLTVRSPFFRGVVSAQLRFERTLEDPLLLGEVTIPRGLFRFPFGNLEVIQGLVSLTVEDPFRPQIFLTAGGRTFGYDVHLEASGTVEDPIIELQSTPGLSSEEIILMLTTGAVPREDFRFTTEQRAARLAFFLGRDLLAQLGLGESGADRLIIRSGEHISEQGRQTYHLEYRLNPDWSLIGEYDRFNAFNAGVKWRFYSR